MKLLDPLVFSPNWKHLEGYCESRIEEIRRGLEQSQSHEETRYLQGRIAIFRELLALREKCGAPMNRRSPVAQDRLQRGNE